MYDLIVIGAGPGGYVAAIRGAQLGLKVALVEKYEKLGGTCLHRGCIPSKAYLAAAEMIEIAKKAKKVGITFAPPEIDFKKLVSSKDGKVDRLAKGVADLIKGNKIGRIQGAAELKDATHVQVGDQILETRFIILATGTEPVRPVGFLFDGQSVLTTDELFAVERLPSRLLIIGGGVSGCEMACAFNLLGSEVTLVELMPEILMTEEKPAVRGLRQVLEKRGVKILTGVSAKELKKREEGVQATLSNGEGFLADLVLVAVGRRGGEDRLGLARLGIRMEKGVVKVNERMETSVEGVYAVGDLVGTTMLAHGAMAEGICAVENIAGNPMTIDYPSIPRVVYTIPEIASIGSREEDLKKSGTPYRAGRFSYLASGKAMCHEEEEGVAQILVGTEGAKKDKVLGATIFGAHAADLIQEAALVMKNNLSIETLIHTIHAHPSLSEIIHEAAEDSQGVAIHKIGRR